jgi:ubiquinone/menaquinone biosynthesis C-methylase UbiE
MFHFNHFEWLSRYYDRLFKVDNPDHIIELVNLPTNGMLLDAGGGTGRVSQQLMGMASSIVIVDFSIGMLKQASTKNGLLAVCAQTELMPFSTKTFERIIMVDAFHHVFNQAKTIQEMWRVVKPGGMIIIEEPDVRNFIVKIVAIVEKILLMRSRFINPMRIATMIQFPAAKVKIVKRGYKSWVILEKNYR